jgi:KUP system potassium uptake protein
VLGAVVLAITGAEALYADMGHFGRKAIKRAWAWAVFPALVLNYLGQGIVILHSPTHPTSPFFMLYPESFQPFVVFIATVATLIASQSVLSGAFSLTHQAIQLGYVPRMIVRYTSRHQEGQVYVPTINWLLCIAVCLLVVVFGSSAKLAAAYGIAVSGALLIDTLLFVAVLARVKHASLLKTSLFATVFIAIDLLFVASTSLKIVAGGWIPLLVAILTCMLLFTWVKGHAIVARERHKKEQLLEDFVQSIKGKKIARLPGQAVYLGSHNGYAPLALEASAHQLHELHEKVVVATVEIAHQPHVPEKERVIFDGLKNSRDGISHVTIRFGFSDHPNVPKALEAARSHDPEIDFNPYTASYFVSQQKPVIESRGGMTRPQKHLYLFMARNAMNASDYYKLPPNTTIQMSTYVGL